MSHSIEEVVEGIRQHPRLVSTDDFEISLQNTETVSTRFREGKASAQNFEQSLWIQLRVLLRRQPGIASILYRSSEDLQRLVESALEAAEGSSADPWFRFPLVKVANAFEGDGADSPVPLPTSLFSNSVDIPIDEVYESCVQRGYLWRREEKVEGSYVRRYQGAQFRAANGPSLADLQVCGTNWEGREESLKRLIDQERFRKSARPFRSALGKQVLLRPRFVAQLLEEVGHWFCADRAQASLSPLSDREGETLFSPAFSLIDEGGIENGVNAYPFDIEGTIPRRTMLINKGVLSNYLHNSYTAARANRPSTGNYLRAPHASTPQIAPSHLYVSSSSPMESDLITLMAEGITLDTVESMQAVPGVGSEILFRASGWAVHAGNRVTYLTGICGKWDLFDVLRRVVAVGKDIAFYGHCGSPSILLENVPLSEER